MTPTQAPTPTSVTADATSSQIGTGSSISFSHVPSSFYPSLVLLDVGFDSNTIVVNTITYGGVSATLVAGPISSGSSFSPATVYTYKVESPPHGTKTVSIGLSAPAHWFAAATSYTGSAASSATGSPVTNSGVSGSTGVTVPSAATHLVHDTVIANTGAGLGPTLTPAGGQTQQYNVGSLPAGGGSWKAGAASVGMNWTFTPSTYGFGQIGVDITN